MWYIMSLRLSLEETRVILAKEFLWSSVCKFRTCNLSSRFVHSAELAVNTTHSCSTGGNAFNV